MYDPIDEDLLRAYCAGDLAAFDELYRRYAARIHATAYRLTSQYEDAEDTLQDVFIKLSKKAGTIRRKASIASWLYRTTVNRSMDCLRKRRASFSLDANPERMAGVIMVESLRREAVRNDSLEKDGMLKQVESLIPRLPKRQAAAFVLRGFQGLSHREIAGVLGCAEPTAKSHFSLACAKLRKWVAEAEREETRRELEGGGPRP